jgi:hypothetical protein
LVHISVCQPCNRSSNRSRRTSPLTIRSSACSWTLQPNQHGRDSDETFLRKEFKGRLKSYEPRSTHSSSLEGDVENIRSYLTASIARPMVWCGLPAQGAACLKPSNLPYPSISGID